MKPKYECTLCSRTFMYKETLEEHNRLHGIIIQDGNRYSCPICLKEVVCKFQSHYHKNSEIHVAKSCDSRPRRNSSFSRVSLDDCSENIKTPQSAISSQTAGAKSSKRGRRTRRSKTLEIEATTSEDVAGTSQCDICLKTFVYLKCLIRHRSSVHGIKGDNLVNDSVHVASAVATNGGKLQEHEVGKDEQHIKACEDSSNRKLKELTELETINHQMIDDLTDQNDTVVCEDGVNSCDNDDNDTSPRILETEQRKNKIMYTCKTCAKTFKYKTTLVRHGRVVHGSLMCDKCMCPICCEMFDNQLKFSRHFDSSHREEAAELLSTVKMDQVSEEQVGQVVRCEACSQWFTCRQSFLKHCGLKHRVIKCSETGQVRYKCAQCGETFETNRQLVYHRHSKHYVHKSKDYYPESDVQNSLAASDDIKPNISEDASSSDGTIDTISNMDESSATLRQQKKVEAKYFCTECSKTFVSVAFLTRHKKLKHTNRSANSLHKHASSKPKKQVFVCGICSEEFGLEEALSEHMDLIHHGYSLDSGECTCPICSDNFQDQSAFSIHYVVAHFFKSESSSLNNRQDVSEQLPHCKACGHWFTDRRAMIAHQCPKKLPVRLKPAGRARYRCPQCGEAFEVLRRFLHHRKVKHRMDGPIVSDANQQLLPAACSDAAAFGSETVDTVKDLMSYCTRGRPPKLLNDVINNSDTMMQDDGPIDKCDNTMPSITRPRLPRGFARSMPMEGSGLKCPECNRSFQTISQLRKHRKAEHRNRTCQLCGETCKSADMVYYHNLKFHHEQKCDVCGASCPGRLGLIQHFRSEHPNEPPPLINRKTLICEYCPRVFAGCASRLLRDHIESCHLGRVHLCDVCGKRLGSAQTLAVHRRMHDPVARFACQECNRRFPHNTNLINHIRKHHPERLPTKYAREFRCEVCSMQFGSSSGLTRHRAEKHSSSRHQCDLCLRVFPSVTGLRVHKRREHSQREIVPSTSSNVQQDSQPLVMVPVAFTADPTVMAGFLSLPGLSHGF